MITFLLNRRSENCIHTLKLNPRDRDDWKSDQFQFTWRTCQWILQLPTMYHHCQTKIIYTKSIEAAAYSLKLLARHWPNNHDLKQDSGLSKTCFFKHWNPFIPSQFLDLNHALAMTSGYLIRWLAHCEPAICGIETRLWTPGIIADGHRYRRMVELAVNCVFWHQHRSQGVHRKSYSYIISMSSFS